MLTLSILSQFKVRLAFKFLRILFVTLLIIMISYIDRYRSLTSGSSELHQQSSKVMPDGNTRAVLFYHPYPVYSKRGNGSHIYDVDGNDRIDFSFNYTVLIFGHNHFPVKQAVQQQLEYGTALGQPTSLEFDLAQKIIDLVPSAEKVKFAVTGTEANMNAVRVARAFTGKKKIVVFEGGYHGTSDTLVSQGTALHTEGVPEEVLANTVVTPYNNLQLLEETLTKNRGEVAAVLMEPLLGTSGAIPPRTDFLKGIREATSREDVLLIFDEIITGFRLSPGGAQQLYGVTPDITTLGKIMGGGLPLAAISGRMDIMDTACGFSKNSTKSNVPISGTYNAHPLSLAAGIATLNELSPSLYEHIDNAGSELRREISKIGLEVGIKLQITGVGSLFNIFFIEQEVVDAKIAGQADSKLRYHLDIGLLNRGVYLSPNHICCVSDATNKDDVKTTLQAIEDVLVDMKQIISQ